MPAVHGCHLKRGKSYKLSGKIDHHIADFEEALQLEETTSRYEGYFSLIESYILIGQMDSAKKLIKKHEDKPLDDDQRGMFHFFGVVILIIEDGKAGEYIINLKN